MRNLLTVFFFLCCTLVLKPAILTPFVSFKRVQGKQRKSSTAERQQLVREPVLHFYQHTALYSFKPLYKALEINQSSLYKYCFLENTEGVAVKSRAYGTKQHGMTDTERCGTWRVSLCKCLHWDALETVIYFSFNQKCSFVFRFEPCFSFGNVHSSKW